MRVVLDPEAIAVRDSFAMLFWGTLLSGIGNGDALALVGAAAMVAVAVALTRLRRAATDTTYRWHLGLATGAACVSALGSVVDALPLGLDGATALLLGGVPALATLVHWIAVIRAMSRLTDLWDVEQLRLQWSRAFRLTAASAVLAVVALVGTLASRSPTSPFERRGDGELIVLFVAFLALALAAFVQYLVAIWRMRSAADRAARVPVPA